MTIDALIHARWIIPIEPAGTVLEHHALAIHDGRILEILDSSLAETKYSATTVTHLDGHALLPGLINTHGHAAMTLMRGLADDLPMILIGAIDIQYYELDNSSTYFQKDLPPTPI